MTWAESVPLWFYPGAADGIEIEGYVPGPGESMNIARNLVAPGYFDLLRIPIFDGRAFDEHDTQGANPVLIVNQTFAQRYFPGRQAVGRRIRAMGEWYTIAGVARDSKYVTPTESALPFFYAPYRGEPVRPTGRFPHSHRGRTRTGCDPAAARTERHRPRRPDLRTRCP
ncbi:MAG: ABC transporter permease [Ignavibacteriota bacterium]